MEYEIADEGENVLFDESTNPSLKPHARRPAFGQLSPDDRELQEDEPLPDTCNQLA